MKLFGRSAAASAETANGFPVLCSAGIKRILHISIILFSCFFILFSACVTSILSPKPSLFDLYIASGETYVYQVRPVADGNRRTYGELYDFLSATDNVKTNAVAVNELIIYAPGGFDERNSLSELSAEPESGKKVLINSEYKPFLTDGQLLLEGKLLSAEGFFTALSTVSQSCF